jgi:multidrug resistance efflux pump
MESLRWLVRGGGPAWFRWTVRLVVLAAIIVAGFLPYGYELGGDCRIVPKDERGVRALIGDEIATVHVTQGQEVPAGYVLATLAARDEESQVEISRAELKRAQANLDLLRAGSRPEDLQMAELKVELWQVQLAFREADLARVKKLQSTNSATPQELERSQKGYDTGLQMVALSQEQLTKVKNGPRAEEIRAAEAAVEAAQARSNQAEKMFALRQITTPIAGRIATLHVGARQGQVAAPGDLIAVVQDTSSLHLEVQAQESTAVYLKPGMVVKVRLNGTYGELLTGKVVSIGDLAARRTVVTTAPARTDREELQEEIMRTGEEPHFVPVVVELDPHEVSLAPGMTGYARIVVAPDYFWNVLKNPILRFFRVDVWSWLP